MQRFKAIFFDMDGIMIDSEVYWEKIEEKYAKTRGIKYTASYHRQIMALSPEELAKVLRSQYGLAETAEQIIAERDKIALEIYKKKAKLMPGFLDLIKNIKGKYKIALVSSSPFEWINPILQRFKLKIFFNKIVSAQEMPNFQGKPHPAIYLFAAKKLRVPPKNCLVFEDSINGIKAAKAAGMYCVAVPGKWVRDKRGIGEADLIVKTLADKKILRICDLPPFTKN